jgi:hypothetical protein
LKLDGDKEPIMFDAKEPKNGIFLSPMRYIFNKICNTVKLGVKELFDKEQIGIKEPFPVTNLPITS